MKLGFNVVSIIPPFPIPGCGHIQQTFDITECKDELNARILYLEDENNIIIHISYDLLGFYVEDRNTLDAYVKEKFGEKAHVITSSTHTHYSGDITQKRYSDYVVQRTKEGIDNLDIKEVGNLEYAYKIVSYDEIGKTRISNYEANNHLLMSLKIKNEERILVNIITYNCHPTTLSAMSTFFSGEYPGMLMKKLKEKDPSINYTMIMGTQGDISTRFTRTGQTYEDALIIADKIYNRVIKLNEEEFNFEPIKLSYAEKLLPIKHEFGEVDLSKVPANLTSRELETIEYGKIMRQRIGEHPEKLSKELLFARLSLSDNFKFIFEPNEMFSAYMDNIDKEHAYLCSYTNGYGPYIVPIGFSQITYELFYDTITVESKNDIIETIKTL